MANVVKIDLIIISLLKGTWYRNLDCKLSIIYNSMYMEIMTHQNALAK